LGTDKMSLDEKKLLELETEVLDVSKQYTEKKFPKKPLSVDVQKDIRNWALFIITFGILNLIVGYENSTLGMNYPSYGFLTFSLGLLMVLMGVMLFFTLIRGFNMKSEFLSGFYLIIAVLMAEMTLNYVLISITTIKIAFNPYSTVAVPNFTEFNALISLIFCSIMIWKSTTPKETMNYLKYFTNPP
jgi:hypothetical protein